ncbi:MAG: hypothetical protein SH847_23920 [Roseiflexaceae bacterium]|nr:hypothetical protein [Roseiflexaceae bacterium]
MSKYQQLRPFYSRSNQERAALVRSEILLVLTPTRLILDQLAAAGTATIQATFGPRCEELVEIALETAENLRVTVEALPLDGQSIADDEQLRKLRHDLRGLVGTLLGAVTILSRNQSLGALADLARRATVAANELRDIVDALMEDQERGSHT